jgi:hypothetical protein
MKKVFVGLALAMLGFAAPGIANAACTLSTSGISIQTLSGPTNQNFSGFQDANGNCVTGLDLEIGGTTPAPVDGTHPVPMSATTAANTAANPLYDNLSIGGSSVSNTNGEYANLLQGNAVLSATNGTYANLLQGNAAISITNPVFAQDVAGATGGSTMYTLVSAASTNSTNVKASAGTLYHISVQNSSAAKEYLILFNSASAPTCTGTAVYEITVPPYAAASGAGGVVEDIAVGLNFSTGVGFCATTASGGTGSVAAGDLTINFGYK